MPISYSIDRLHGLLTATGVGSITDDDLSEYKEILKADPDLACVTREISDFREATFAVSPKRIPEIANLHGDVFGDEQPTKCAVIVSGDLAYGLVRMYAQCVSRLGHEVLPFHEISEARKWLGLEPECEDE